MNGYLLEKVITHPDIGKLPIIQQSNIARVFQNILEEIGKENPYATLQSLLEPPTDDD